MLPELQSLGELVCQIAQAEIMPRFAQVGFSLKEDGSLLTEADLACNKRLQTALQQRWPHIAFLSEEMPAEQQSQLLETAEYLWCLDPLDGTSNFAAGMPLFAANLALIQRGEVVLAVTYDPVRDELFSAEKGKGAYLNNQRLQCQPSTFPLKRTVALVDLKRLPTPLKQALFDAPPYGSQRNLGSCALEWAWLAAGRGHIYLHGGMQLWDLAAGVLLLSEAGGYSATLTGEPVFKPALMSRSVVASSDKQLFQNWLDYLQAQN